MPIIKKAFENENGDMFVLNIDFDYEKGDPYTGTEEDITVNSITNKFDQELYLTHRIEPKSLYEIYEKCWEYLEELKYEPY